MANRLKGETQARADGRVWTLRMDFNALCAFEADTGRSAFEVLTEMEENPGGIRARDLRDLVHACLGHHHPDATKADAGLILSEDMGALERVAAAAMPSAADATAGQAGAGQAAGAPSGN